MREFMQEQLGICLTSQFQIVQEQFVGQRMHIFSHISQQQLVYTMQLKTIDDLGTSWINQGLRKMLATKISNQYVGLFQKQKVQNGMSSGVKKAFQLYLNERKINQKT
eukprot:TRINITY_DN18233_c0_g1_i2.p4 TRINITY_DN18233_c0_g1~~TRINITY_DN18233_c0_g1_i2.p4  ORF type:complete len:108 (+),score=7.64 TRINITY_DN18233_c0_g1_i2:229-552(+)